MGGTAMGTQERAEQALNIAGVNQMIFLGVVAEDPLVCYGSLLQKLKAETGEEKTQLTVFATTILKGKAILFYLFAPYMTRETVTQMLARHRVNVGRLQRANRE